MKAGTFSKTLTFLLLGALSVQAMPALAASGGGEIAKVESIDEHFHPKGNPPSEHTLKVIRDARERMPFADRRDFEEAEKGFIAPLKSMVIEADAGHVACKSGVEPQFFGKCGSTPVFPNG